MQIIELKHRELDFRSREAFKMLRSNVEFSGENIKVVFITSCIPNEGKSNISFELAKSYAQLGKKVLLLDADVRKSVMRRYHKRGKVRIGLTNYLVGKAELNDAICSTNVEGFHILFSGPVPPNPSELLGGKRFQDLIETARENYDMIIIDTPPLGSVIDAAVVSKHCDGALLVIASGAVSYRFARRIKEQLQKTGCPVLGCVLNKVKVKERGYYSKYYNNKYYGKYYSKYYRNYE